MSAKLYRHICCQLLFVFTLNFAIISQAETMSPIEIYQRCYIRMVRQVPDETDPLFLAVQQGHKPAAEACVELFDRAQFVTLNHMQVLKNRTYPEAKAIVRTFHDLHRSWFQAKGNGGYGGQIYLIYDMEEPALYYTRAAFSPGVEFRSILTYNSGLQGVRDQKTYPQEYNNFLAQRFFRYAADAPFATSNYLLINFNERLVQNNTFTASAEKALTVMENQIVEVGKIVGVKPTVSINFSSFRANQGDPKSNNQDVLKILQTMAPNFEANAHFGGGVIGSQGFLLANANLDAEKLPDGYSDINRRLTSRIFEDLLCHQLPSLTVNDVQAEVLSSSTFTFQQQATCMQCHSSIDGMAFGGFRNLFKFVSGPVRSGLGVRIVGFTKLNPMANATTFAAQLPAGKLHYRELVSGRLYSDSFSDLADLGQKLAAREDLYNCAAKRYYKFLTGVDVDLTQKATKVLDKLHQDEVLSLGRILKTQQSVRALLKAIFSSKVFQTSHYQTEPSL